MDGILYLIDDKNKKRYVQIDLEKYGEIWEDFYDLIIANSRENEPTITLEELEKELKEEGLLQ
jgi:hypothetical protein